jgi:two-component system KDP operon response regulator KdpE
LPSRSPSPVDLARILVVEDERPQQIALEAMLNRRGYDVDVAGTAAAALRLASVNEPDLVLLDLGLPDGDGLDVCRHLRTMLGRPIIVVSADPDGERIVAALDGGADDYVTKPFLPNVLLARVRVALRHAAATAPLVQDTVLRCGDVVMDVAGHQVKVAGSIVDLQARAFALLAVLIRNEGKVLTYRTLMRALDGSGASDDLNALRVLVSKVRKTLGAGPRRPCIVTELNVGYRLELPDAS